MSATGGRRARGPSGRVAGPHAHPSALRCPAATWLPGRPPKCWPPGAPATPLTLGNLTGMLTGLLSSLSYALIRFWSVSAHRLGRAERGNIVPTRGSDNRWIPANYCGSLTRSTATRTSTRRSSSRASKRRWSPPPRSTTAKRKTSQVTIDRDDGVDHRHPQRRAPVAGGDGRADRRPDRQAGDDPEDPRGRAGRPVRRVRGTQGATGHRRRSSATKAAPPPSPWPTSKRSSPAASRSPAKRTTPTSACGRRSTRSARRAAACKVILSRTKPQLVQRLFEQEIPEIADGVIEIRAIAREPGYRTKVAVSSTDQRVDCVGACVGVRGNRIKNIVDELGGERIDIVRWSDDMQVLIPNALQPAEVEEVILCQMLGRAIVLVREDQLSLAIGRRGQNVRLASKLCGWDIEIMTREELDEQIEQAVVGFSSLEGVEPRAGREAGGRGLPVLRRPVGDRARRPDGDGRPDAPSRSTRSSPRPRSRRRRPRRPPPSNAACSASRTPGSGQGGAEEAEAAERRSRAERRADGRPAAEPPRQTDGRRGTDEPPAEELGRREPSEEPAAEPADEPAERCRRRPAAAAASRPATRPPKRNR